MTGRANRILLVDDDISTIKILVALLNKQGFHTTAAYDGEEAWKKLQESPDGFDLVILDREMPGLDGLGLLRRMKENRVLSIIPVIFQTGHTLEQDLVEGFQCGAHGYLAKPINPQLLLAMIRSTIQSDNERYCLQRDIKLLKMALRLTLNTSCRFKTLEEAEALAFLLGNICPEPDRVRSGLYELFVNAVEHGNLEISYSEKTQLILENRWQTEIESRLCQPRFKDRFVNVDIEQQSNGYDVLITDQGSGFDFVQFLDFDVKRIFDVHGKGIAMATKLYLDEVEYLGCGNQVRVFVRE